jgi:hypothetical protein
MQLGKKCACPSGLVILQDRVLPDFGLLVESRHRQYRQGKRKSRQAGPQSGPT